ncbi:serine-rich adhesin for platelets-like isoform X1 [Haliotis asinina]|uniref:serine-rich adhesin for platelets-like isoform X1 n=1 Tax=Haliotis asinina TaxID=109174 RepID=UPI003532768B
MDMFVHIFVLACLTCIINGSYIPLRLSPSPTPSFTPSPFRQISQLYKGPFQGTLPPIPLIMPRPGIAMYSFPVLPLPSPWTSPPPLFTPIVPVSSHRSSDTRNRARSVGPVRTTAKGGYDYARGSLTASSNTGSTRPATYDRVHVHVAAPLVPTAKFSFNTQIRIPNTHVKGSLDMPVGFIINTADVGVNSPRVALVDGIPANMQVEGVASSHENTQSTRPPGVMNSGPSHQYQDITQSNMGSQRRTPTNAREPGSLTLGLQMDNQLGSSYEMKQMSNYRSEQGLLAQSNVQSHRARSSTRPGQTPSGPQQNSENYGRSGNIVFLQGSKQHSISQPEVMQGVVHSMASQAGQTHNEPKVISSEPNLYESTQNVVFDFTPKEVSGSLYDQQTYQPTQTVYSRHRSETGTEYQYASGIVNSISAMNPATAAASTEAQTKSSDRVNVLQDVNINRRMEAFDAQPDGGVVGRNIIKTTSKDMRGIDTLGTSKEVPSIQGATSSDMKNTMQARAANGNQVDVSAGRPGVEQSSVLTVGQEKMNHASAQHDNQHLGHNLLSNQAASTGDLSTSGGQQYISNQVAATNGQYGAVDLSPSGTQQSLSHQIASTSEQYSTGDLSMSGGQQSIVNQAASTSGQYATGDMSASGGQQSTSNQAASIGDLSTSGRQQSIHDQAASTNWQYSTGDLSNFGGQQSVANQTASTSGQYTIGDVSASGGQKSTANQAAATADLSTSGGQQYISNQVASTNGQYSTGDLSMSGGQQSISSQAVSTSEQYTTGDVSASGGLETTSNQVAATGHLLTSGRQQSLSDQITSTSGQYATADLSTSGGQQSISNQVAATNGQYGAVDLSTSGRQQSLSDQMTSTSEHYSTGDLSMPGGQQSISSQAVSTSGQYTTGDVSPSGGLETTSNQAAATGHLLTSGRQQSLSDQIASTSGQYTIGDLSTSGGHQSIPDQNASTHGQYATADLSTSGGHQSIPDQTASTNGQYATADLSTSRGHQSISSQAVSTSGQYTTGDVSASGGLETISNQAAATGHLLTSGRQQSLSDQIASTSGQYATGDLSTSGGQQSIFNQAAAGGDLSTSGGKQSIPDQAASTNGQNTIGDLSTSGGQQSISNQAASTNGQYGAVDLSTAGRQQSLSDQITSTSGQYTTGDMSTIGRQQSISNQPASVSGQYEPVDFPAPAGHQPAPSQGLASRSDQYGAVDLLTSGGQQLASAQATTTSEQYNIVDIQTSGGQQSVSNHAASPSEQYGSVDVSVSTGQQLIPSQVVTSTGEHRTVAGPSRGQVTRDQSLHQGITPSSTQHGTKDMTKTLGTQVLHDLTQTTTNNGISTRPVQQDAALGMNKIKQEIPEQPVGHATETSSMVVGLPQLVNDQTNLNQYLRVSPVATDAADHLGSVERQYLKNIDLQGQMPIVAGAFGVNGAIGETQDTFHNHVQSGLTGQGRDSVSGHSGMQEIHSQSGAPDLVSDQGVISPVGQSLTQDMASNGNQYDNLDLSGGQGWLVASGQYAPVESTRPNTATVATGESTYTVPTLFPAQDSRLAINNHLEKEVVTEQSSVGTRNILQGGIAGTSLETEFMSLLLQSRSQDAQSTNTHYDPLVGQGNVNATQLLQRNHVLKNTNTFNASKESSRIENTRSGFSVNKPNSNTVSIPSNRQNPHLPVLNEVDTLPILPSSTRAHDTSIQTTFEINPVTKTASGTNHKASSLSSAQKADKTVGNDPIDIRIAPATIKKTKDSLTNGISSRITEDTNASATERARMAVRSDTSLSLQKTSPIQSMTRPSLKSFDVFQPMEYGGGQKQKSNQMFDSSLPSVISETTVPAFATRHQEFISFPQGKSSKITHATTPSSPSTTHTTQHNTNSTFPQAISNSTSFINTPTTIIPDLNNSEIKTQFDTGTYTHTSRVSLPKSHSYSKQSALNGNTKALAATSQANTIDILSYHDTPGPTPQDVPHFTQGSVVYASGDAGTQGSVLHNDQTFDGKQFASAGSTVIREGVDTSSNVQLSRSVNNIQLHLDHATKRSSKISSKSANEIPTAKCVTVICIDKHVSPKKIKEYLKNNPSPKAIGSLQSGTLPFLSKSNSINVVSDKAAGSINSSQSDHQALPSVIPLAETDGIHQSAFSHSVVHGVGANQSRKYSRSQEAVIKELPVGITPESIDRAARGHSLLDNIPRTHSISASPDNLQPYIQTDSGPVQTDTSPEPKGITNSTSNQTLKCVAETCIERHVNATKVKSYVTSNASPKAIGNMQVDASPFSGTYSNTAAITIDEAISSVNVTTSSLDSVTSKTTNMHLIDILTPNTDSSETNPLLNTGRSIQSQKQLNAGSTDLAHTPHFPVNTGTDIAHSSDISTHTKSVGTQSNTRVFTTPVPHIILTTQSESTYSNTSPTGNPAHYPYLTTPTESVSTHSRLGSIINPIHPTRTTANIGADYIYSNRKSSIITFPGNRANSETTSSDIPSVPTHASTITSTVRKQSNTVSSNIQTHSHPPSTDRDNTHLNSESHTHSTHPTNPPTNLATNNIYPNTDSSVLPSHPMYTPANIGTGGTHSNTKNSNIQNQPTYSPTNIEPDGVLSYLPTHSTSVPTNSANDSMRPHTEHAVLPRNPDYAPTKPQADGTRTNTEYSIINKHTSHVQANTEADSILSKSDSSVLLTHPATDNIYSNTDSSVLVTHPTYTTTNPSRGSTHLNSGASNLPTHPTYPPTNSGNHGILSTSELYILPTQPARGPTNLAPDSRNSDTWFSSPTTHPSFASTHTRTASTNSISSSLAISPHSTHTAINSVTAGPHRNAGVLGIPTHSHLTSNGSLNRKHVLPLASDSPRKKTFHIQTRTGLVQDTIYSQSQEDTAGISSNHNLLEHHSNQTKQNSNQTLKASKCVTETCIDKAINQGKLYAYLTRNVSPEAVGNMQLDATSSVSAINKTDTVIHEISSLNVREFTSTLSPEQYNTKTMQAMESSRTSSPPNIQTTHLPAITGSVTAPANTASANIINHPTHQPTNNGFILTYSSTDSFPTSPNTAYVTHIGSASTNAETGSSDIPSHFTYAKVDSAGIQANTGASGISTHSMGATQKTGIDDTHSKTNSFDSFSHSTFAPTKSAYNSLETSTSVHLRSTEHSPTSPVHNEPASTHQDSSHSLIHETYRPLDTQSSGRHTSTGTLQVHAQHTSAPHRVGPDSAHLTNNHLFNDKSKSNLTKKESLNHTHRVQVKPDSSSYKTFHIQTQSGSIQNTDYSQSQVDTSSITPSHNLLEHHSNQTKQNSNQTLKASKCVTETCIDKAINQGKLYAYLTRNVSPEAVGNMQLDATSSVSAINKTDTVIHEISSLNVREFTSTLSPEQYNTKTMQAMESSRTSSPPNIQTTHLPAITGSVTAPANTASANIINHPTHQPTNNGFILTHSSADSSPTSSHTAYVTHIGSASTNAETGSSDIPSHFTYAKVDSAGIQANTGASGISTHSMGATQKTGIDDTHSKTNSFDSFSHSTFAPTKSAYNSLETSTSVHLRSTEDSPTTPVHNEQASTHQDFSYSHTSNHNLLEHHPNQTKQNSNHTLKTSKCVTETCIDKTINQGKLDAYLMSNVSPKAIGSMQLKSLPSLPTNNKTDSIMNETSTLNISEFTTSMRPEDKNRNTLHITNSLASKSDHSYIDTTHMTANRLSPSAHSVEGSANGVHNPSYPTKASVDRKHLNKDSPNVLTYPQAKSGLDNAHSSTVSAKTVEVTNPSINTGTDSTQFKIDSSTSSEHPGISLTSIGVIETLGTRDTSMHPNSRPSSASTHTLYHSTNTGSSNIPTYPSGASRKIAAASMHSNTVLSNSQTHPTYPPTDATTATTRSNTVLFDIPSHVFYVNTESSTSAHSNTISSKISKSSTIPPTNPGVTYSDTRSSNILSDLTYPSKHNGTMHLNTVSHIQSHSTNPPRNTETGLDQSETYILESSMKAVISSTYSNTGSSSVSKHPTFPTINTNTASGHLSTPSTEILNDPPQTTETPSKHSSTVSSNISTNPTDSPPKAGTVVSSITGSNILSHTTQPSKNTIYRDLNTGTNVPKHSTHPSRNTATSSTRTTNIPTNSPSVPRNTGTSGIPSNSGSSTILEHPTHALINTGITGPHSRTSFANIPADSSFPSTNTENTATHGNSGSKTTSNTVSANSHSTIKSSSFLTHHAYKATNSRHVSNKPGYPTPYAESATPSLPEVVNAQTSNVPFFTETFASTNAPSLSTQHSATGSSITHTTGKQDKTITPVKGPLSRLQATTNTRNGILPVLGSSFDNIVEPSATHVPRNIHSSDGYVGAIRGVSLEKHLTRSEQLPTTTCHPVICIDKTISKAKVLAYLDSNVSPKAIGKTQSAEKTTSYDGIHPHVNTVSTQTVASVGNTVHQILRLNQSNTVSEGNTATTTMQDTYNQTEAHSAQQSHQTQNMNLESAVSIVNQIDAERHARVPLESVTSTNCTTKTCRGKMTSASRRKTLSTHNIAPSDPLHLDGQPLPTKRHSETISSVLGLTRRIVIPPSNITHLYFAGNSSGVNQDKNNNTSTQKFSPRCQTPDCIDKQKIHVNATLKTAIAKKHTSTSTGKIHSKLETLFHTIHRSVTFQDQPSPRGNGFTTTESYKYTPKPIEGQSVSLSENSINPIAPHDLGDSMKIPTHLPNNAASSLELESHTRHVSAINEPLSTNGDAILQDYNIQHYVERYGEPNVELEASITGGSRGEASVGLKQSEAQTNTQRNFQKENNGFGTSSGSKCNKTETCIDMHISHSLLSAFLARKLSPTPIGQMSLETVASSAEYDGSPDTLSAPHIYISSTRDSGYNSVNPVQQQARETSKELNESEIEVKTIISNDRRARASGLSSTAPLKTSANDFANQISIPAKGASSKTGVSHGAYLGISSPELHRAAVSTEMGALSKNSISNSKQKVFTSHNALKKTQSLSGIITEIGGRQKQTWRLNGGGEKSKEGGAHRGTDRQLSTSTDASSPTSPPSHPSTIPPIPSRGGNTPNPPGLFDYTAVNGQGGGYTGTTDYGPITNDVMQFLSTQGFSTLDAYLQNELSQTLDSPVPYTSSSSSASSQGSTSGTGTTAVKTLTQSQPNQLPPDTVASPAIDVHNPPLAESSQQDAQTHDAVNDIKMQNVATKPLDNSNNMVFDVAMGVQGQNTQHSFKNQEGTLRTGRSTKAVISESIVDPLLNAPQVTATRLSPDESGFISMTGTGHTKSKMSLQGHSHQRQTMKLSGIQMLPQGMSGHLMGSQTGQGEPTKTFGLKMNVNTGGFSSGTSHQSSSAGTTTTSFNSQHDVGGVEWDPNQPSSATTNSLPSIPIPTDAYSSQQLTDMNVGDTHLGTPLTSTEADPRNVKSSSLLTSVANEMPSFTADLHSTFSGVQASSSAGQVMSTSEGSKAGVSDFNRGLDSATWNGQPDSTAAHQKITEAPEFYEPAPRYVDSDQGDSGDGQEMSQNTVNTEPTKYNFDVSKDRQMSPHDGQQVLSNTERSSGYADYFPSTSLSSR